METSGGWTTNTYNGANMVDSGIRSNEQYFGNNSYQKKDKISGIIKGEAGHIVDSFIRYQSDNLNLELITP